MFAGQKFAFWPKKYIFTGTKVRGIKIRHNIRAVPETILKGGWAAGTFLSCGGGGGVLLTCPRGGGGG